jgi:hypothetical protein
MSALYQPRVSSGTDPRVPATEPPESTAGEWPVCSTGKEVGEDPTTPRA